MVVTGNGTTLAVLCLQINRKRKGNKMEIQNVVNAFNDYQAARAARDVAVVDLQAQYPNFVPGNNCVIAAKNMRIELRAAFPGVKFSVTSDQYSMGDSVRVRWTDGPTVNQVEAVIGKYEYGRFDGMTDSYEYYNNSWNDAFGGTKYLFTNRELSDAMIQQALDGLQQQYGTMCGEPIPTVEMYKNGLFNSAWCDVVRYALNDIK